MLGYCCNVHPGRTLAEVFHSLNTHSRSVKQRVAADRPLGIGLWLSATAAIELQNADRRCDFRDWLQQVGLVPYTLNGFPYGDFHQPVVKHQVYQPTWADEDRLRYTIQLADILHDLLPAGLLGTISTLPLGWPSSATGPSDEILLRACAANLQRLAHHLANLRSRTGRLIVVCIEPEPGCVLDSAADMVQFFDQHLGSSDEVQTHLGVCHDICHSAVMFEPQAQAVRALRDAKISIRKVQVSSAVGIEFDRLSGAEVEAALTQLEAFDEPKYLHQTCWRTGEQTQLFEDLPQAIAAVRKLSPAAKPAGELRVHFHVPIFAERLGLLSTTQAEIEKLLTALSSPSGLATDATGPTAVSDSPEIHFEVETYAWNVLPEAWRLDSLSEGIARELEWLQAGKKGDW